MKERLVLAEQIQIGGGPAVAKIRSPWAPALLPYVTFGIYFFFWWYNINRELRDLGKQRGLPLGDSPGNSVLAVTLGAFVVVPAVMSFVGTYKRVKMAQRALGTPEPLNGWVYYLTAGAIGNGYMQSGLNKMWRAECGRPIDWIDEALLAPQVAMTPPPGMPPAPPMAPPPPPPPA
ncbi:MAG: DUF4234 domain-containing protein [Vicinamibacterales bacterium]|nr:DUF4234 domain-containing protein [Vicinamibacterales bacterium]